MLDLAPGWKLDVDRGPDWLFVRVYPPPGDGLDAPPLAETVWSLLEQSLTHRVVLELDQLPMLNSQLIGQLVLLSKRVHHQGGLLRLCGLSSRNQEVLRVSRLDSGLPHYADRGAAVMGSRPAQPR